MKKILDKEGSGLIRLDEFECCALARGFAKNPHTVRWLIDQAKIDKEKLRSIVNGLNGNNVHLAFLPNEDIQAAYVQIAKEEAKRLDSISPEIFDLEIDGERCGHLIEEHKKALKSVIVRLSERVS